MKVRIAIGLGGSALDQDTFAAVVAAMAELRFDSVWISEILTGPGPDPLIALATAAQLNPKLKLGTTMLLPGRNLLRLAKSLATVDVLSSGRLLITFVPGLAVSPEREAIGVPVKERAAALEAGIPMLRRWWAGEEIDGIRVMPRPVQDPLEIWLGGLAPHSLARCGRIADGWLGASCTPGEAEAALVEINRAAEASDRAIDPEHFGMSIGYADTALDDRQLAGLAARLGHREVDPRSLVPVGHEQLRSTIAQFVDIGVSKFVLRRVGASALTGVQWRDELAGLAAGVADLQT